MAARALGKNPASVSSRVSLPWSARRRMAAAVKCLLTDAIGYEVSAVAATPPSTSADPYPLARTGWPCSKTPIDRPAMGPRSKASAATASTAAVKAEWSGEGEGDGDGEGVRGDAARPTAPVALVSPPHPAARTLASRAAVRTRRLRCIRSL